MPLSHKNYLEPKTFKKHCGSKGQQSTSMKDSYHLPKNMLSLRIIPGQLRPECPVMSSIPILSFSHSIKLLNFASIT